VTGFTDHEELKGRDYSPRRRDYIAAGAGHILLLLIGAFTFSGGASPLTGGEDAIMVRMVTTGTTEVYREDATVQEEMQQNPQETQEESVIPEEVPEEIQEVPGEVQEEVPEDVQEVPEDVQEEITEDVQEVPEDVQEVPEDLQEENDGFAAVSSMGDAGAGAPGPGTYESRVFNAVRRGYRTSVTPLQSYRIILTVLPDGSTQVEVVRKSGTSAFDRAVENAIAMAQIPPMPPGRAAPAVINIEFLGPE